VLCGESGTAKDQTHEASLDRRRGGRCARDLRASFGTTGQSVGRSTDAVQRGHTSYGAHPIGPDARGREEDIGGTDPPYYAFGLRHNIGGAPGTPSRGRPPRDAWPYGPWPEIGDGYDRTAEPIGARPPAGWGSPAASAANGTAPAAAGGRERHRDSRSEPRWTGPDAL